MLGNVFILGDSYSTFKGYIPEGHQPYYAPTGPDYIINHPELTLNDNDVYDVTKTWWYNLATENGSLLLNSSWSGSTICNTGYGGEDYSNKSFTKRIENLIAEDYFKKNRVDTFFLFGGTNDSWADAPLGEKIYSGWTKEDLYHVFPAFTFLIDLLLKTIPDAKIYCIINTELKPEIVDFYKSVCEKNNIGAIELYDIEKIWGHPTVKGMAQIKEQILEFINKQTEDNQ